MKDLRGIDEAVRRNHACRSANIKWSDFDVHAQLDNAVRRQLEKAVAPIASLAINMNSFSRNTAIPGCSVTITVSRLRNYVTSHMPRHDSRERNARMRDGRRGTRPSVP
jgi:hypothetical protein